jgi:hypothetical protein
MSPPASLRRIFEPFGAASAIPVKLENVSFYRPKFVSFCPMAKQALYCAPCTGPSFGREETIMTGQLRLAPLRPEHVSALRLRPRADSVLARLGRPEALAARYAEGGPAWTLLAHDWPLACGGAVRFWPGVGELWCWAGEGVERFGVGFARQARAVVALGATHGFHRLQAHVLETDQRARSFALFLGLMPEGRCPGFGPDGTTYMQYGRYAPWKE